MPYRKTPLVTGEIYHVFNRSIARQPILNNQRDYQRMLEVIEYYRFPDLPIRFSHFRRLSTEQQQKFEETYFTEPFVSILAYCLMPNHFHFLLKAHRDRAVSDFIRNIQNSYSKYFNLKYERTGSLFQAMFKAVRIETDTQLVHVSRYIHLNPVSAFIIEVEQLDDYLWSSYQDYTSENTSTLTTTGDVLFHFKTKNIYKSFVLDQSDYQRKLAQIKHLIFE